MRFMWAKYKNNKDGNVASMFALGAMTLLVGIGVAVDYTSISARQSNHQSLADAAALAAARTGETDKQKLAKIAKEYVNANYRGKEKLSITTKITKKGRLQLTVSSEYKTVVMGAFGTPKADIGALAEVPLATSEPVNIALVLDSTFSMQGNKMASLKSAAGSLVSKLESKKSKALKISVVPFAQYVNIGKHRRGSVWLDVPEDSVTTGKQTCWEETPVIGYDNNNCKIVNYPAKPAVPPKTCYKDGIAYPCGGSAYRPAYSKKVCQPIYGSPITKCKTPTSKTAWHGCVGSRAAPWDSRAKYANHKIPGLMDIWCNSELLPLTDNFAAVKASINSLNAKGVTYMPAGLVWGWRTLSKDEPFKQAGNNSPSNFLILMTDGANTISKTGITHAGNDVVSANKLTAKICQNIKDDGIKVFTIAYDFGDPAAKKILKKCATNPGMYFDAKNAAGLQNAFEQIGDKLLKLRLTH